MSKLFKILRPFIIKPFQRYKKTKTQEINDKETHFGYETVKESEKTAKVHKVFENVAYNYDLMNDAMSMGIHRIWKDIFMCRLAPMENTKLIDMAGGTGDIAFRFLDTLKNGGLTGHVTVCDINENMLKVGKLRGDLRKYSPNQIGWQQCNAEELPFETNAFDAYTIAFGIRNVTHIQKALDEAYRVLTPGGRFMCLEFSQLTNQTMQWVYDQYSFQMIPVMGQILAGDWHSYQYLVESIRRFPDQLTFKKMIENSGFRSVNYENLTMGVVAIHSGFKLYIQNFYFILNLN